MHLPNIEQDDDIERIGTFLAMFYHQSDDIIVGTTRALQYIIDKYEYRRDLAYGFKRLLQTAPSTVLLNIVREDANRNALTVEDAISYLTDIIDRNNLRFELDPEDEAFTIPKRPD